MKPSLNPNLLDQSKTYIVAVSFGPDSMALLHLLHQAGFKVEVAHVNYHLRKESDLEQSQLEQFCFAHDLPIHILDVASMPQGNLQAQARTIRYDFFQELVMSLPADGVLTAHHQDDDLETAMMQRQRSSLYEYFGIRAVGDWHGVTIYRPLLNATKQDLLDYCHLHQIPYAIDQSNAKLIYQRNRTRAQLKNLSLAEKNQMRESFQKANEQRQKIMQSLQPLVQKHTLAIKTYLQWEPLTQFLFWILLNQIHNIYFPITETWLKKIEQIFKSTKPNILIPYSREWHVEKAYDQMWFLHDQDTKAYEFLNPQGTLLLPLLKINLARIPDLPDKFILRSCKPNDLLQIKTYAKPFRRLAIDWKMPLFLRRVWPVFTTLSGEIILLPRYQKNLADKANNWLEILE